MYGGSIDVYECVCGLSRRDLLKGAVFVLCVLCLFSEEVGSGNHRRGHVNPFSIALPARGKTYLELEKDGLGVGNGSTLAN